MTASIRMPVLCRARRPARNVRLADPAPILHALMTDAAIGATHVIDTMVTVVDPVHGEATLDGYPEARRRIALADRLVFSKTDLASPGELFCARLAVLNPVAAWSNADQTGPGSQFGGVDPLARAARIAASPARVIAQPFNRARHTDGIETESFRRSRPLPTLALTLWLQALTELCGDRLIRMKELATGG